MKRKTTNIFFLSSEKIPDLEEEKTFDYDVKTPTEIKRRKFCFVVLSGERYLADIITGSLYSTTTGYCMSTEQLKIVGGING